MDQADICTPDQEATTAQPFVSFCVRQNQRERHCSFKDALLPSAQLGAWLLQHYRQGKHRQWQQAGWKQDNRFIWQHGFLNEQQPPEELHPDMPKPSALMKALNSSEEPAECYQCKPECMEQFRAGAHTMQTGTSASLPLAATD